MSRKRADGCEPAFERGMKARTTRNLLKCETMRAAQIRNLFSNTQYTSSGVWSELRNAPGIGHQECIYTSGGRSNEAIIRNTADAQLS